jgi:tetratricopeptide (TPR) repeat protein
MTGMRKKPLSKKPLQKQNPPADQMTPASSRGKVTIRFYGTIVLLFIVSMIALSPMVKNDFIPTWDDGVYVIQNQLIKDISWHGILNIFSYGDEFQKLINNYHPLTTFSLALNYQVSGLSPGFYHMTNLVLHGFNAVLVFLFVYLLSRRKMWPAIISGLLFAIHPMHVESVAWVSERKDVLYTFFFLAGLIAYLKYREDEKVWKLGIALLLFLCSCLSKAMAVPFPLILLLIDYFQRRRFSWKLLLEKIPFFIVALIIGLMSIHLQSLSAINKFETFTVYQRIMHASYGFFTYIIKFINPSGLSAFYPYPPITTTGLLPLPFRIAPYICMGVVILLVWVSTRKGEIPRVIVFGILFYFFTIALVLQFLSVGKAIMADRYTYIPYIGLSFILGMLIDYFIHRKSFLPYIGYGLAAVMLITSIVFSFMTYERTKVWKNDITLWSDAISKYPDGRLNFIYKKRAEQYIKKDQYEAGLTDYLSIAANDPRDDDALGCIGQIYGKYYNDMGKAVENLEKAYAINPKNPSVLKNLGVAMGMKGDFPRSLDYLLQAYKIDKTDTTLLRNISASYNNLGMPAKAKEFDQLAKSMNSK